MHAPAIARWLKAGGHLLALELDADQANKFLPVPIRTTMEEHIAAYFETPAAPSPFAGIGPADVHNRDPRKLPLVSGGAEPIGNGVLARAEAANVVFCQLAPYRYVRSPGDMPGFSVSDEDAVEGKRSALLTMGTVPWGQFGQKVKAGQVGKTYTFAVFARPVDDAATVRLEVERAGRPWDRAVRGEHIRLTPDKWTQLHVTFQVDKPYPEGWSAYIHCGQVGVRLRADLFQLNEGKFTPTRPDTLGATVADGNNMFTNSSFETGTEPWFFNWKTEQQNLRKTYRRTSFLVTRLLANMGVRGQTPLLSRFSTPASGAVRESIVKNGDLLVNTDDDPLPDHWQFTTNVKQATCVLDESAAKSPQRSLRITCPPLAENERGSLMLAQHEVPVQKNQWYRISLKAKTKGKGFGRSRVTLALQNTATWRSLFEYQRFAPREEWRQFAFLVRAKATATSKTRFQIWHGNPGTLWIADIRMSPCDPPSQGRWTSGLYVDHPQPWDDPYRFFRW
jgi:hypothetical protein